MRPKSWRRDWAEVPAIPGCATQAEPGPREKDQVNFTDEESRGVAEAAVDVDTHLVVGGHVSDKANDKQEMAPALERLDAVQEVVGRPQAILADAGYMSDDNVRRCEAGGIEPYIASGRERHNAPGRAA